MQPQEQIRSCKQVDLNHINEMRETETCHFRLFPYEQEQDVGYHGNIDLREDCILRFPEKLLCLGGFCLIFMAQSTFFMWEV